MVSEKKLNIFLSSKNYTKIQVSSALKDGESLEFTPTFKTEQQTALFLKFFKRNNGKKIFLRLSTKLRKKYRTTQLTKNDVDLQVISK